MRIGRKYSILMYGTGGCQHLLLRLLASSAFSFSHLTLSFTVCGFHLMVFSLSVCSFTTLTLTESRRD